MSIKDDVIAALAGVAPDDFGNAKVFPDAAPQDVVLPMVIVKRVEYAPENVLAGTTEVARSKFVFECWATTQDEANSIAADVVTAIEAQIAEGMVAYRDIASGEDYQPETDEYVEPVYFSFWHDE